MFRGFAVLQVLQTRALRQAFKQDVAILRARRLELGNSLQVGPVIVCPQLNVTFTRVNLSLGPRYFARQPTNRPLCRVLATQCS
jgi:hypothetical protein